jgi:diketogulonate reductase-like aldo/keto reductase
MHATLTRRTMIRGALAAAGAPLLAGTHGAWAQPAAVPGLAPPLPGSITRVMPKTNEAVPVIGLGSFLVFDVLPGGPREHVRQVLQRFWDGGGRVVDTSPLYGTGETSIGDFAAAMGITNQMFIANKLWSTGEFLADDSHARRSLDQSLNRLWRERIDVMKVHSLVNVDIALPLLRAWKKEGRIRQLGVSHYENPYHPALVNWIERGNLDVVQVNYSIFNRAAEATVIKAAAERGVAVFANMPFEKNRLFKVVEGRPLPDFARELGIASWAQYFLKWVVSNPSVTCCIPATSNPEHAAENMAALRGPLPDAALRERMVRHMETLPGFGQIATQPWYPDKRYPGITARAQAELRARS